MGEHCEINIDAILIWKRASERKLVAFYLDLYHWDCSTVDICDGLDAALHVFFESIVHQTLMMDDILLAIQRQPFDGNV